MHNYDKIMQSVWVWEADRDRARYNKVDTDSFFGKIVMIYGIIACLLGVGAVAYAVISVLFFE